MSAATSPRVVFGCPRCKKRSGWPNDAYGKPLDRFVCGICGALGEDRGPELVDLVIFLKNIIDEDMKAVEKAAEREKALERLVEIDYSAPEANSGS